jgi:hypothetical protein
MAAKWPPAKTECSFGTPGSLRIYWQFERFPNRRKQRRRVATRYDRVAANYLIRSCFNQGYSCALRSSRSTSQISKRNRAKSQRRHGNSICRQPTLAPTSRARQHPSGAAGCNPLDSGRPSHGKAWPALKMYWSSGYPRWKGGKREEVRSALRSASYPLSLRKSKDQLVFGFTKRAGPERMPVAALICRLTMPRAPPVAA